MWTALLMTAGIIQMTTSAELPGDLINLIVDRHNQLRTALGVNSRVSWNRSIAAYSETRAELQRCKSLSHAGLRTGVGENLAMGTGRLNAGTLDRLIWMWVSEGVGGGHHDQMAWAGSTSVGCATTVCNSNLYLACDYTPPGNVQSQSIWSGNPMIPVARRTVSPSRPTTQLVVTRSTAVPPTLPTELRNFPFPPPRNTTQVTKDIQNDNPSGISGLPAQSKSFMLIPGFSCNSLPSAVVIILITFTVHFL